MPFIYRFSSLICFLYFLTFLGCQSGGGFQDIALVRQAKRELRVIRNALEEYRLDHGYYPSQESDLKVELEPYFSKLSYSETSDASKYSGTVLSAQSNLDKIMSALSGCARIKEPQVEAIFARVSEVLKLYEESLKGEFVEHPPVSKEILKIQEAIDDLKPLEAKSLKQDSLVPVATRIMGIVDSLSRDAQGEESEHLQNIRNTFKWYKAEILGQKLTEDIELYSPEGELGVLVGEEGIDSTSEFFGLQKMIEFYRELESSVNYCDFLIAAKGDIERASKLAAMLELLKIEEACQSAVIVQAQTSLHRMAEALRDYRRENGRFPEQNVNIDSILHTYFVETVISGEQIDRWHTALEWFSSGPVYKTEAPERSFVLEADVNNEAHTYIFSKMMVQNKWDETIEAFSCLPIYTTPDSTPQDSANRTYFIKVRAKDSGSTWVTDRPPVAKKS